MPTESELRRHRCCFTGHRPHKLHQPESVVIAALEQKIRDAVAAGFVTFISGMAWGVDIWAAEIVLKLKKEGHPIHLIAVEQVQPIQYLCEYLITRHCSHLVHRSSVI